MTSNGLANMPTKCTKKKPNYKNYETLRFFCNQGTSATRYDGTQVSSLSCTSGGYKETSYILADQ